MTPQVVTYRRRPRTVFRVLNGRGLIRPSGRPAAAIEGAALFAWYALDSESSRDEVLSAIRDEFPELGDVVEGDMQEAIDMLVSAGLVEVRDPEDDQAVGEVDV